MSYPIEQIRHSAAHVMAAAILRLFPQAKFGVGPAVESGFYYDVDIGRAVTPEDLNEKLAALKKAGIEAQPLSILEPESLERVKKLLNEIKAKKLG